MKLLLILRAVYIQSFINEYSRPFHSRVIRRLKLNADAGTEEDPMSMDRRSLIFRSLAIISGSSWVFNSAPASAGLVLFPCTNGLKNIYHLMRAGESLLETQDIFSTNALFLTNHEDVLSPRGMEQVQTECKLMIEKDIMPSVVKFSLAAKAAETANIIASELKIGRNRLTPEYTFMDPRAVGKWDMLRISTVEDAIWAFDEAEAGSEGRGARPPLAEDSTPNETLFDQSIRLRQLMSALETQYSGDTILLIFPDGTSPALLSAMISGIPFNRVHELEFNPGEIRFNVTVDNVLNHLATSTSSSIYKSKIRKGREYLGTLLQTNTEDIVNVKEEQERAEIKRQKELSESKKSTAPIKSSASSSTATLSLSQAEHVPAYGALLATMLAGIGRVLKNDDMAITSSNEAILEESPSIKSSSVVIAENEMSTNRIVDSTSTNPPAILAPAILAQDSVSEKSREEKVKVAEDAMEKYLSEGDGGDEWLGNIADIINEK